MTLRLFGTPRLNRDGVAVHMSRRRAIGLLAYLATDGIPRSRDSLMALFWTDHDPGVARADVRRTLSVLNKALGKGCLAQNREEVGLVTDSGLWVDVREFERLPAKSREHDGDQ